MNLIKTVLSQHGVKEIEDRQNHPQIIKYFNVIGFDGEKLMNKTAWCCAFVNWETKTSGYEYSSKLHAWNWLSDGGTTKYLDWGDIVILWKVSPISWKSHVGFYTKETGRFVNVLGGNQLNTVSIKAYHKYRTLDFKKLK